MASRPCASWCCIVSGNAFCFDRNLTRIFSKPAAHEFTLIEDFRLFQVMLLCIFLETSASHQTGCL